MTYAVITGISSDITVNLLPAADVNMVNYNKLKGHSVECIYL